MVFYMMLFIYLVGRRVGLGLGLVALFIALDVLFRSLSTTHGVGDQLVIALLVLAIPCTGYLAGSLLDHFVTPRATGQLFQQLVTVLAAALILSSPKLLDYLFAMKTLLQSDSLLLLASVVTSLGSSIVFCAGLIAFVIILLQLLFELPVYWFTRAGGARVKLPLAALRPLTVVLVLGLAFNLIIALCVEELWPTRLLV